ncbi:hypothetical protein Tsubulata_021889 [Turnera subulata]|uniref:Pentatricopeptide repeat-containing protein n=1 Tax=Turnera subulata TaxID=218843 RepID=A0A9Q0J2P5_9ROSI|nr:hypothetical protein Tsubulata_021889 [Turnera subulata]
MALPSAALRPLGFDSSLQSMAQSLDVKSLLDLFADWTAAQCWADMKQVFEFWIRSLDKNGKPNQPNVDSYNHYLRANYMTGASPADLLDLVAGMEDYGLSPNTASFNFILKAMHNSRELDAAQKSLHSVYWLFTASIILWSISSSKPSILLVTGLESIPPARSVSLQMQFQFPDASSVLMLF